jgi:hypothetical protein
MQRKTAAYVKKFRNELEAARSRTTPPFPVRAQTGQPLNTEDNDVRGAITNIATEPAQEIQEIPTTTTTDTGDTTGTADPGGVY